jgi:UDP-N-acetylmuramate--alanine ligase
MSNIKTEIDIKTHQNFFFIGIAGDGMSAIAQYLCGIGKNVYGSDRQFSSLTKNKRQMHLENAGISCFPQDASGLNQAIDMVIISSAIESTVEEYKKALELEIPVVFRSDLLAAISKTKKTIAVGGTSGKSTVTAMIFHILHENGYRPSLITGAGLITLEDKGFIGNAYTGTGEYLVIEADESDGSIVKYTPEIGLLLNIDKDHKEISELKELFSVFTDQSKKVIVNQSDSESGLFSHTIVNDFGYSSDVGFQIGDFKQIGFRIQFTINQVEFTIDQIGIHNAENCAAAVAASALVGISVTEASKALETYKGIYRRHQIISRCNDITLIDDYAHNPAKLAASIKACQFDGARLFVWFQPHGFQPTRFLKEEYIKDISNALRENDEIYLSDIYFAGGTVEKDISSIDLVKGIIDQRKKAYYICSREDFPQSIKSKLQKGDIVLLTGARDPSLNEFAGFVKKEVFN